MFGRPIETRRPAVCCERCEETDGAEFFSLAPKSFDAVWQDALDGCWMEDITIAG